MNVFAFAIDQTETHRKLPVSGTDLSSTWSNNADIGALRRT
jgi:hypothetical protein